MSDVAKPDPAADQTTAPGATLVKDETAKVTTDIAANKNETETKDDKPVTEKAADAASSAAAAVKDNVFSMFGGGPAKAKKEEADDVDEPSGASKPKGDVCAHISYARHTANFWAGREPRDRGARRRVRTRCPPHREGRH